MANIYQEDLIGLAKHFAQNPELNEIVKQGAKVKVIIEIGQDRVTIFHDGHSVGVALEEIGPPEFERRNLGD